MERLCGGAPPEGPGAESERWREVGQVHGAVFGAIRPATSMLEVSALIDPALLVEIEADAVVP